MSCKDSDEWANKTASKDVQFVYGKYTV